MNTLKSVRRPLAGLAAAVAIALSAPAFSLDTMGPGVHYAPRGQTFRSLPHEAIMVPHRGGQYWFRGGEWYRPYRNRFVVVAPPLGAVVPVLPGLYTTFWFGGVPYYFANDAYYLWRPELNGYVVTSPPPGAPSSRPSSDTAASDEPFIYPKNGQSESQQATDRYECHRWAADQTAYDPTEPATASKAGAGARAGYLRAMTACLEGRGYSVK